MAIWTIIRPAGTPTRLFLMCQPFPFDAPCRVLCQHHASLKLRAYVNSVCLFDTVRPPLEHPRYATSTRRGLGRIKKKSCSTVEAHWSLHVSTTSISRIDGISSNTAAAAVRFHEKPDAHAHTATRKTSVGSNNLVGGPKYVWCAPLAFIHTGRHPDQR